MSGLCGWFSRDPGALTITQMATPLARHGEMPLLVGEHGAGALALAAWPASGGMLHEDGILAAIWGERPETLMRLWRSHGPKACAALSGSFVLAVLDERRGEALLAVDRTAARPLYYQQVGRTLLFASCADSMVQHPGAGREIDPQALYNYLYFHDVPAPASIYKGPRRLLPGEFLHLQGGRVERARYWNLQFQEQIEVSGPDLKQEFADTMRLATEGAISGQEQPVGVLLSGGLGSAAVASFLAGVAKAPLRTYSVGYEAGGSDSLSRPRQVARQLGSVHNEHRVSAAEVADAIPRLAAGFDQPLGDPGALAAFFGAGLARGDGVLRLLGGHGAAELFGCRPHYAQQARLSQYEKVPSALRQTVVEPLLFHLVGGADAAPLRRARSYIVQALVSLPERMEASNLLHGYGRSEVVESSFMAGVDPTAPAGALNQSWWASDGVSQVNQMIALDLKYSLADRQLPGACRACDLSGLDIAFPFLGDAVVAFAARLAPHQKLDGERLGPFLRDALRGIVARKINQANDEPAAGELPFGYWLQSDDRIRALAFDSLSDLKRRGIIRAGFIDTLLATRLAEEPAYHGRMVWLLMMLEQWFVQRRPGALYASASRRAENRQEACRQ
jgi:asparagine synthase (glutamine-hydrolysing)